MLVVFLVFPDQTFVVNTDETISQILAIFQKGTRQMQIICSHGKVPTHSLFCRHMVFWTYLIAFCSRVPTALFPCAGLCMSDEHGEIA